MIDIRHLTRRLFKRIGLSNYIRPILFFENRIKKIGKYRFCRSKRNGYFYFYLDPSIKHPGLADRLKAMVSCYYIAKQNGYQYEIVFDTPFSLKDYLKPNAVEWYSKEEEIEYSIFDTKIFDYTGKLADLKPNKNYICFNYSGVLIKGINNGEWCQLFSELFCPSENLTRCISNEGYEYRKYIAIHLRFVNALGRFEKGKDPLPINVQEDLIVRCKKGIKDICDLNNNHPVIVFSDSSLFLEKIHDLPVRVLRHDNIKHISTQSNSDVILKTFVDFMMISRASKVYRILSPEMYSSSFSYFAAIVGDTSFYDYMV